MSSLTVSREITVPATGSEDFARTVDVFTNPSGSAITTTVRIVSNLGSDAATAIFTTSDGDNIVETTDQWIGTDDGDGTGTPAIIHYIHGPAGVAPTSVGRTGDNIEWTYNSTVPAGATVRLASFTIVANTRAAAEASATVLVTPNGFGGQASFGLTATEAAGLVNFPSIITVTNTADSGAGSLRQALLESNSVAGTQTILFNIPGPGPHTIAPPSTLPTITEAVTIDGWSEPDFAGTPIIEIRGDGAGTGVNGLTFTG
jgi:hypothetical protein